MAILHCDFETYSTVDLRREGVDNYVKHPSTGVWCMAFAFDDEEPRIWVPDDPALGWESDEIAAVHVHVARGGIVVAHNAIFEICVWNRIMVPRYGWPFLDPSQVRCTLAMSYAQSLPGALENAAPALGIDQAKDQAGKRLMLQMAKPREVKEDGTVVWWDDADKRQKLYDYCKNDMVVERALEKRLMPLSDSEQRLWTLDALVNQRGIYVDQDAVRAAIAVVELEQARLNAEIRTVTKGYVSFATEVSRLTQWVQSRGVDVDGVAKADIVDALAMDGIPDDVRAALLLRQEAGKSSTAKLKAMLAATSSDGRLRHTLQYHGAATGRWAGRRVQLHNMPRPTLSQEEIEDAIDTLLKLPPKDAVEHLRFFHGSPMAVISSCLRGMLCAAPGHDLFAADFSAIEARVLAWLAGEEQVLDVFRGHGKIYEHAAAGIYRKPIDEVAKDERQVGKVAVLALGYGGGVGAFQTMAKGYGVKVGDERAEEIKQAWREAHRNIVEYWYHLEDAAKWAVWHPGQMTWAGVEGRSVKFKMSGSFLFCLLPSGRVLTYPYPKIKPRETPWGESKDQLHYMTVDGVTNKWGETHTYGGKLSENVTQAVARDLLAYAITNAEAAGFPVVLHVHDEVVAEVPRNAGRQLHHFEMLCAETPKWAEGLPVTAEGWRGRRYRK